MLLKPAGKVRFRPPFWFCCPRLKAVTVKAIACPECGVPPALSATVV